MTLNFWKYEGAGNDFIIVDGRAVNGNPPLELPGDTVRALCDRHRGVGADGLIVLRDAEGYDFRMEYHNSDGGEANMCGNGGRCIALFAHHMGIAGSEMEFIGRDGTHRARILVDNDESAVTELSMADVSGYEYSDKAFFLNTGVPHYVEFVDDLDALDATERGREVRYGERFNDMGGTNVDFVKIVGHGQIAVRTYERGVEGETLACGTGVVAAAIATHLLAQDDCTDFTVTVGGGMLDVSFRTENNQTFTDIKLTGPARRVFRGEVKTSQLI